MVEMFAAILPEAESGVYPYGSRQSQNAKVNQKAAGSATSGDDAHPLPSQRWFISAWGIIALVLFVIIFSTFTYYAFLLYPYLCKKETTYDIIELTEVNSVCTVSDNVNNVPHMRYCDSNDIPNNVSNDVPLNQ